MKLLFVTMLSIFFLASCAHHHKDGDHHHHKCDKSCELHHKNGEMFDKHCASSVSEGDMHVMGSDDFKLNHGGQVYYFSTKEKLNLFKKNIEKNIKSAQRNWETGSARRR